MPDFQVTWACTECNGTGMQEVTEHGVDDSGQWAHITERDCVDCEMTGVTEEIVTNYSCIWDCAEDYKDAIQIANMEFVNQLNVSHKIVSYKLVRPESDDETKQSAPNEETAHDMVDKVFFIEEGAKS